MEGKSRRIVTTLVILILAGLFLFFIVPISLPLILALLTAMLFEPLIRLTVNKLSFKRIWAVILFFGLYIGLLGTLSYMFISKGIAQVIHILERIPSYTIRFIRQWEEWSDRILAASEELPLSLVYEINMQLDGMLYAVTEPLRNFDYLRLVTTVGTWIPLFLVSIIVYLIAVFLIMIDFPRLRSSFYSHLKEDTAAKIRIMSKRLSEVVVGFIKAQFLVSVVIFLVSWIGLLFISPEIALVMALVIWFIDFIPIVGSIVIVAPWALLELAFGNVFESTSLAILAAILLIIRRTLEPKVMGRYIGLSPLATLISMFLGVKLIGVFGFFVGPLVLIAYITAKEAGFIKMDFKI